MLPPEALRSMRVMVATPCYASGVMSQYAASTFGLAGECVKAGLPIRYELHAESLITRGRNKLVALFLSDPSLTHLFFIDADVGFTNDQFFRLLLSDLDVVTGVYPLKRFDWPAVLPAGMTPQEFGDRYTPYPINPLEDGSVPVNKDWFGEVSEAPTGFMCIKRGVFDKMRSNYPVLQYTPDRESEPEIKDHHWLFFDTMVEPTSKRYLSEDYAFCRRWRDIGGKVFVDIKSKLTHQGQHSWQGDLHRHLETRRAQ